MVKSMGKGTNNSGSERIYVRLTPELAADLKRLARLGLHGSSVSDVARHLIMVGVQRVFGDDEVERTITARNALDSLESSDS